MVACLRLHDDWGGRGFLVEFTFLPPAVGGLLSAALRREISAGVVLLLAAAGNHHGASTRRGPSLSATTVAIFTKQSLPLWHFA